MASMTRQEAGRKGAEALNRDPAKKSAAAKKAAATRKKLNADIFRIMGRMRGKAKKVIEKAANKPSGEANH